MRREIIMQSAAATHGPIIGKSFDQADRATATAWGADRRTNGIKLFIATDHEAFQEVIEIAPPGTNDPRWCIWRAAAGHLIVDNWHTWERGRPFTAMGDALRYVATEIQALQRISADAR
jgi:hypothetical protein